MFVDVDSTLILWQDTYNSYGAEDWKPHKLLVDAVESYSVCVLQGNVVIWSSGGAEDYAGVWARRVLHPGTPYKVAAKDPQLLTDGDLMIDDEFHNEGFRKIYHAATVVSPDEGASLLHRAQIRMLDTKQPAQEALEELIQDLTSE